MFNILADLQDLCEKFLSCQDMTFKKAQCTKIEVFLKGYFKI